MAFSVFFFEPETIRKIFLKKKNAFKPSILQIPANKNILLLAGSVYFIVQLFLPIRHHLIKDEVLWTEEGHRMSWRMMLRSRTGKIQFKIVDKKNGSSRLVNLNDHLTLKQKRKVASYPDFIWQFAQQLKNEHAKNGDDIAVYALNSKVSINGRPYKAFIDPNVDLASVKWSHFKHHDWILPSDFIE
jgi:hypothetical protein